MELNSQCSSNAGAARLVSFQTAHSICTHLTCARDGLGCRNAVWQSIKLQHGREAIGCRKSARFRYFQ